MISDMLKQSFPEVTRGFSERNIRLFCSQHEIHKRSDLHWKLIVLSKIQHARYVLECTLIICIERLHTWRLYLVLYFGHVFLLNIEQVGATYGRKMMAGYVRSKGHVLSKLVTIPNKLVTIPNSVHILSQLNTRNTCLQQPLAFISNHCVNMKYYGLYQH